MKILTTIEKNIGYEKILLSTIVAIFYYLFQNLMIFIYAALDGYCLYSAWLDDRSKYFSLFALSLEIVILITLTGLAMFGRTFYLTGKVNKIDIIYYSVFFLVMGYWLIGFNGMWRTFEFEKGHLTKEEYAPPSENFYFAEGGGRRVTLNVDYLKERTRIGSLKINMIKKGSLKYHISHG